MAGQRCAVQADKIEEQDVARQLISIDTARITVCVDRYVQLLLAEGDLKNTSSSVVAEVKSEGCPV